ncbi:unnamed protein product [Darwinula stevensoni]|uniref:Uncharacterized protein n=1 Tax=Darwinula stevensoni TaxID=69355 RepID=A0A7R8X9W9_9CRUS|nr:unnamed protein product [Darwinula stevensoni]CAG0889410.1 unnamed protein product [Darwinula stevensoni]
MTVGRVVTLNPRGFNPVLLKPILGAAEICRSRNPASFTDKLLLILVQVEAAVPPTTKLNYRGIGVVGLVHKRGLLFPWDHRHEEKVDGDDDDGGGGGGGGRSGRSVAPRAFSVEAFDFRFKPVEDGGLESSH